jgi:hypothetical protein
MKTVGERYAYFYARIAELELRLRLAQNAMCDESMKRYMESAAYVKEIGDGTK